MASNNPEDRLYGLLCEKSWQRLSLCRYFRDLKDSSNYARRAAGEALDKPSARKQLSRLLMKIYSALYALIDDDWIPYAIIIVMTIPEGALVAIIIVSTLPKGSTSTDERPPCCHCDELPSRTVRYDNPLCPI
jgi:hypothetical protein